MLKTGYPCDSVIFPVAQLAVHRHCVTLECAFVTFYDFLENFLRSCPLTVAEVCQTEVMRYQIPDISFLDFQSFFVFIFHPHLMERLVSAYIGVLEHRQPQTFMQSCEDRRSLRQQRSYRPASDPEVVVSKPG